MGDEHFGVRFYKLKETNCRSRFPREDELVTLEHNTNQEIEVIWGSATDDNKTRLQPKNAGLSIS